MINGQEKVIIALDYPNWKEAEKLVLQIPEVKYYKVGLELYLASRGEAVQNLKKLGKKVFLDLKFHDIPNTVAQACCQAVDQGADILNVHALGGKEMMAKSASAVQEQALKQKREKPLLIAVTLLTSMNEYDLQGVGLSGVEQSVGRLAHLTKEAGLDGVVASPREIKLIREKCGKDFKIICPGVRPTWAAKGDQKRVLTPKEALALGADFLVIGRPITKADNPREAAQRILEEVQ